MEGVESIAESQAQDSQSMSENVEGFQKCVKEILTLIKQDENFSELTAEFCDCKKSKLTKLVNELSRMHGALADQNVRSIKEVGKNTHKSTTPLITQPVDSSNSTSPQVTQTRKTQEFMTPVDVEVNFIDGGGFGISRRETSDSDSESIKKQVNSPVKNDASKVKEIKVNDSKVLLKKISNLEKEVFSLKRKLQNLTDENAILEAEKANVADLKLEISKSNRKIETMGKVLEATRKQLLTTDEEYKQMKQEMCSKVFGNFYNSLEKQVTIENRDEQITELNTQINLLNISHAAEVDSLNTIIERLKTELREKCEFMDNGSCVFDG